MLNIVLCGLQSLTCIRLVSLVVQKFRKFGRAHYFASEMPAVLNRKQTGVHVTGREIKKPVSCALHQKVLLSLISTQIVVVDDSPPVLVIVVWPKTRAWSGQPGVERSDIFRKPPGLQITNWTMTTPIEVVGV